MPTHTLRFDAVGCSRGKPTAAIWCCSTCPCPWPMAGSPQDCEDPNPLIRALAVRTMGCIRVDKITEYLCEPLRKCLKDEDPYVRKTAAVCVAKLHDINAQLVEDQGFLDTLKDLISDSNPMVSLCCPLCYLHHPQGCLGSPELWASTRQPRFWAGRALRVG